MEYTYIVFNLLSRNEKGDKMAGSPFSPLIDPLPFLE